MIGPAHQHQLPVGEVRARECLDEVELPLLGHQAADAEHIPAGREAEPIESRHGCDRLASRDPVRDDRRGAAVLSGHQRAEAAGDHDYGIGEPHSERLAPPEHRLLLAPPFLPVVVGPVVSHHHAETREPRQRDGQARPDAVNVQDVGPTDGGVEHAEDGVNDRFQSTRVRRPDPMEPDAAPRRQRRIEHVTRPDDDVDQVAQLRQGRRQVLDMGLDAALNAWDPAQSEEHDAESRWVRFASIRVRHNLAHHLAHAAISPRHPTVQRNDTRYDQRKDDWRGDRTIVENLLQRPLACDAVH